MKEFALTPILALSAWFYFFPSQPEAAFDPSRQPPQAEPPATAEQVVRRGDEIMTNHGSLSQSAHQDLLQVRELCNHFVMIHSRLAPEAIPDNVSLTRLLVRGGPGITALLTPGHHCLGTDLKGRLALCDRWSVPYCIHFTPSRKASVISAGPDRIFGNDDDLSARDDFLASL